MTTIPDKYTTDWKLASMLEYAWGDVLLGAWLEEVIEPARRLGAEGYLNGPQYPVTAARWLAVSLAGHSAPTSCVDVGGGLGRVLVELLRLMPSLETATLAEPSPTLSEWNRAIFANEHQVLRIPFLKGVSDVGWAEAALDRNLPRDLLHKIRLVQGSVDAARSHGSGFDLVMLLNVLDQSGDPLTLAAGTLALAAPGGFVCVADSYQYLPPAPFATLHELFSQPGWAFIAEVELPFVVRTGERHRHSFLSHHVLYQKVA